MSSIIHVTALHVFSCGCSLIR